MNSLQSCNRKFMTHSYQLSAGDLEIVLTLTRANTLAQAAERLGCDSSTVFRSLQRIERGMQQRLFARSRTGYLPTELALSLVEHAEQIESQVEAARSVAQTPSTDVAGTVRISTTDTLLRGLVVPALRPLEARHPQLVFELHASNEPTSLSRRDADIAVRSTRRPPADLVGKRIGAIQVALFAARRSGIRFEEVEQGRVRWICPDEALPDHPSVVWRRKHFPKAAVHYKVNSFLSVLDLVALGLGVGMLPVFLARGHAGVLQISEPIEACQTDLWLLTHRESRQLRRVSTVFRHLGTALAL